MLPNVEDGVAETEAEEVKVPDVDKELLGASCVLPEEESGDQTRDWDIDEEDIELLDEP